MFSSSENQIFSHTIFLLDNFLFVLTFLSLVGKEFMRMNFRNSNARVWSNIKSLDKSFNPVQSKILSTVLYLNIIKIEVINDRHALLQFLLWRVIHNKYLGVKANEVVI